MAPHNAYHAPIARPRKQIAFNGAQSHAALFRKQATYHVYLIKWLFVATNALIVDYRVSGLFKAPVREEYKGMACIVHDVSVRAEPS